MARTVIKKNRDSLPGSFWIGFYALTAIGLLSLGGGIALAVLLLREVGSLETIRLQALARGLIVSLLIPFVTGAITAVMLRTYGRRLKQPSSFAEISLNGHAQPAGEQPITRLTQIQKRYRDFFNEAPVMYVVVEDRHGQPIVTECNERFLETLGYARHEVIGRSLPDFYSPTSRELLQAQDGFRYAKTKPLYEVERQLVRRDGQIVDTLLFASPELNEAGVPVGSRGAFIDISDRKRIQKMIEEERGMLARRVEERTAELKQQRDLAMQVVNTMGQGLTIVDEFGRFTFVNPAYAAMVNEKPETLLGKSPFDFAAEEAQWELARALKERQNLLKTTYETRLRRADGEMVDVLITGVPQQKNGGFSGSIAVITDLTQQKKTEAALRKSEAEARKLSQVASRTDNLVIITDNRGIIEWVNQAFSRTTGYSLQEMIGRWFGEVMIGPETDGETVALMRTRLQEGRGFNGELLNYAKGGRTYWVEIEIQPVYDHLGRLNNFIAIESDVTERRRAETHLRQAKEAAEQAAQAKTAFLASMSHEIRTPLNGIIGLNSLLLNTPLTAEQREYAETARNSGNLLLMLINNVLDYSALEAGRVEMEQRTFLLERPLQDVVELLKHEAEQKGVKISCEIAPEVPRVLVGDDTRLRQLLLNLMGNSLKFTPQGKISLHVSTAAAQNGRGSRLLFQIADTGIGIPSDRLDRLFQPFTQIDASTTRKYGGTGLGLAISKMIVNQLEGEIWAKSELGKGSTFYFTVNMAEGDRSRLPMHTKKSLYNEKMGEEWPLSILLVEDDEVNQHVATHMLEQLGYLCDVAGNGHVALAYLEDAGYDIIFMDVYMPLMDGLETTRRIRGSAGAADQPWIIAMTASALEGDRERFIAAGMDDYLSKPVQVEGLAEAIYAFIQAREERSPSPSQSGVSPSPSPPFPPPDPIDRQTLRQRIGDDEKMMRHLVSLFLNDAEEKIPELAAGIESGDLEQVQQLVHALRGSASSVAATDFSRAADDLDALAARGSLDDAALLVELLYQEIKQIRSWLANEETAARRTTPP